VIRLVQGSKWWNRSIVALGVAFGVAFGAVLTLAACSSSDSFQSSVIDTVSSDSFVSKLFDTADRKLPSPSTEIFGSQLEFQVPIRLVDFRLWAARADWKESGNETWTKSYEIISGDDSPDTNPMRCFVEGRIRIGLDPAGTGVRRSSIVLDDSSDINSADWCYPR
jgi:hypothetical protein